MTKATVEREFEYFSTQPNSISIYSNLLASFIRSISLVDGFKWISAIIVFSLTLFILPDWEEQLKISPQAESALAFFGFSVLAFASFDFYGRFMPLQKLLTRSPKPELEGTKDKTADSERIDELNVPVVTYTLYKDMERLATKAAKTLSKQVGDDVGISLKILRNSLSPEDTNPVISTLLRDSLSGRVRDHKKQVQNDFSYKENSAFAKIIDDSKSRCFASNDLFSLAIAEEYNNSHEDWFELYNSTMVVPVYERTADKENIIAFVCADSMTGKLNSRWNIEYMRSLAKEFRQQFILLNKLVEFVGSVEELEKKFRDMLECGEASSFTNLLDSNTIDRILLASRRAEYVLNSRAIPKNLSHTLPTNFDRWRSEPVDKIVQLSMRKAGQMPAQENVTNSGISAKELISAFAEVQDKFPTIVKDFFDTVNERGKFPELPESAPRQSALYRVLAHMLRSKPSSRELDYLDTHCKIQRRSDNFQMSADLEDAISTAFLEIEKKSPWTLKRMSANVNDVDVSIAYVMGALMQRYSRNDSVDPF